MPGSPTEQEQAPRPAKASSRPRGQLGQLALAAHERAARRSPARARPPPALGRQVESRVLREDRPLELAQPLARLDAELLDQRPARVLVGLQRVRLAVASGRGRASAAPAGAPGRGARRSAPPSCPTTSAWRPSASFASISCSSAASAQLLEPGDLALRERLVGEVRQRRAAPQRQRLLQRRGGALGAARRPARSAPRRRAARSGARRGARDRAQLVAALAGHDHAGRPLSSRPRAPCAAGRCAPAPSWRRVAGGARPTARRSAGRC